MTFEDFIHSPIEDDEDYSVKIISVDLKKAVIDSRKDNKIK